MALSGCGFSASFALLSSAAQVIDARDAIRQCSRWRLLAKAALPRVRVRVPLPLGMYHVESKRLQANGKARRLSSIQAGDCPVVLNRVLSLLVTDAYITSHAQMVCMITAVSEPRWIDNIDTHQHLLPTHNNIDGHMIEARNSPPLPRSLGLWVQCSRERKRGCVPVRPGQREVRYSLNYR